MEVGDKIDHGTRKRVEIPKIAGRLKGSKSKVTRQLPYARYSSDDMMKFQPVQPKKEEKRIRNMPCKRLDLWDIISAVSSVIYTYMPVNDKDTSQ